MLPRCSIHQDNQVNIRDATCDIIDLNFSGSSS